MRSHRARNDLPQRWLLPAALLLGGACVNPYRAEAERIDPWCVDIYDQITSLLADDGCDTSSDCAEVQLPPPWGCNQIVNRLAVEELESLRNSYQVRCDRSVFNCFRPPRTLRCEDGRCVPGLRYGGSPGPSISSRDHYGRRIR